MPGPARTLVAALGLLAALALCMATPAAARDVLWQAKDARLAALWAGMMERAGRSDRHGLDGTIAALSGSSPPPTTDDERIAAFERALAAADLVLLGEVHDNPFHHAGRADWLRRLAGPGRNAPLVSEHFRADQQVGLDRFHTIDPEARRRAGPAELFRLVEWSRSGWPDEAIFAALYAAAIETDRHLFPAEPARGVVRTIARGGAEGLAEAEQRRLGLDVPLAEPLRAGLAAELRESHCGLLPDRAIPGLLLAQRYRDAVQADALLKAYASDAGATAGGRRQAILIAGNGHVRSDRGVPYALKAKAPQRSIVVVLLIETRPGVEDVAAFVPRAEDGTPTADFIVLAPRQPRPDPCEEMRRHMQKRREGQPSEKK